MSHRVALMPAPVAGPLAAPFGRMQSAPLPSQKTWMDMMERLEAKYGPKKGKKEEEGPEEEEGQEGQEEATLQEGPARVPGQIARHGQAREERQFGHDLASIGASLPPGRSYLKGLAQTFQFA